MPIITILGAGDMSAARTSLPSKTVPARAGDAIHFSTHFFSRYRSHLMISANSTILFQGDSITDASRNRELTGPNVPSALGSGYVNLLAAHLLRTRPADKLRIYNRGISGHRVVDLYARWKVDTIALEPNVLSILIGINDTWHEFMSGNGVEPARYETIYRLMLAYTRQQLPGVQLVLCEPFYLPTGVIQEAWIAEIRERQQIVQRLAGEFSATFVPFQTALDDAQQHAPPAHWAADGVHPTPAGHRVLASCWYEAVVGEAL